MYKKQDWGYFKENTKERIQAGYGSEVFVGYTLRHKVRLWLGIRGSLNDKYYFYSFANGRLNKLLNKIVNLIPTTLTN